MTFAVRRRIVKRVLAGSALALLIALAACSPFYVMRAAWEESKLLAGRHDIKETIARGELPPEELRKLQLVLDARDYAAARIGLTPKDSFTKYTHVDKEALAWILVASRPDAFDLYKWWFPVVGSVPYKGYFEKKDALTVAACLRAEGYETRVRGAETFSTLGWFNDPLVTPTLREDDARIVDTVIHESLHSTLWIPDEVPYNESMANFVGSEGAVEFYRDRLAACAGCDEEERTRLGKLLHTAEARLAGQRRMAHVIEALYAELDALYKSDLPRSEKLARRVEIFERQVAPLRKDFPRMTVLKRINNAEIIQLKLYLTGLDSFAALFEKHGRSWPEFLKAAENIAHAAKNHHVAIFAELEQHALATTEQPRA